jgi:hypothetical protein
MGANSMYFMAEFLDKISESTFEDPLVNAIFITDRIVR